jgi:hypothetical protein
MSTTTAFPMSAGPGLPGCVVVVGSFAAAFVAAPTAAAVSAATGVRR